ncbi:MAG: DNA helicase, partial [Candidatus Eremiobacteraeota bacterium]|nr:DNA helicase [Candidatus Eremiobacteraeota bacterium]
MATAQVAISADFLKAFSRLPKAQQKKVREFTEKFRQNPTASGLNYEKINGVDPKVRSLRIDQTYRAIVVKPPEGDVFLCAWVDHHDEAYAWAKKKRFEINPHFGHLQVYEVQEQAPEPILEAAPPAEPDEPRLLDGVSDEELEVFGVPPALFPSVRGLRDQKDLKDLEPYLPADVADALYLLSGGMTAEEVIEELCRPAKTQVDTQ